MCSTHTEKQHLEIKTDAGVNESLKIWHNLPHEIAIAVPEVIAASFSILTNGFARDPYKDDKYN